MTSWYVALTFAISCSSAQAPTVGLGRTTTTLHQQNYHPKSCLDAKKAPLNDILERVGLRGWRLLFFASLMTIAGVIVIASNSTPAGASVGHPSLAPDGPRRDTPIVLDGAVYTSVQLHDRVIVGGDFSQVQITRDGPIVERDNLFAYDINSGEIIEEFADADGPVLDMVSDPEGNAVYLGGAFTQIDEQFEIRVAKVGYEGALDPTFRANASAQVQSVDIHDNVLYLGGSFTTLNGQTHDQIGAVDATTGETIEAFDIAVIGALGVDSKSVRTVEVLPDGQRLLVLFAGRSLVDGLGTHDRYGIGFIDLNTYTVTPWRTQWYEFAHPRCNSSNLLLEDAAVSPDGTHFVVGERGGFICDKIISFDTTDDGVNDPRWVTAAHDSVFSVEITNHAVYAGGHFCYVRAEGPVPTSEAPVFNWQNKPAECDIAFGNDDIEDFAARQQLAALDPLTGEVLDWNPTSNAATAVYDIEAIDRGLLIGQDNDRINQIRTGRHGFLDFGVEDEIPPPEDEVPPPEDEIPPPDDVGRFIKDPAAVKRVALLESLWERLAMLVWFTR